MPDSLVRYGGAVRGAVFLFSSPFPICFSKLLQGDPLELRPGAGVENKLSAHLGTVFVFQMTPANGRVAAHPSRCDRGSKRRCPLHSRHPLHCGALGHRQIPTDVSQDSGRAVTGVVVERDHIWAADRLCGERHAGSVRHIIVKLLMRGCRAVTSGKRNRRGPPPSC
jgi:hypothetical protein